MEKELYTKEDVQAAYAAGLLAGACKPDGVNTIDYLYTHLKEFNTDWVVNLVEIRRKERHRGG